MKAILLVLAMLFSASSFSQDVAGAAIKGQIKGKLGAYNASIKALGDQIIALQPQADEITKQTQFFNAVRGEIVGDEQELRYCLAAGNGIYFLRATKDLEKWAVSGSGMPDDIKQKARAVLAKYPIQMMLDRLKAIIGGAK